MRAQYLGIEESVALALRSVRHPFREGTLKRLSMREAVISIGARAESH